MKKFKLTPVSVFILGFISFGIADIIFVYMLSHKVRFDKNGEPILPMKEFILNIITFGLYGIYWVYKINLALDKVQEVTDKKAAILLAFAAVFPIRFIVFSYITYRIQNLSEKVPYLK